jgi:PAS domain S-box-containing protein
MTSFRKPPLALWWLTLLGAAYFVAGKFGLSLAIVNASATPVWPPTGIALAAFLLFGSRVWPAVLVGAFLVNITTTGSIATSIGIAVGNTLEGRLGADLVSLFANGRGAFDRARDVFKFFVLAGFFATTVSATIGVTSLTLAGYASWIDYGPIWFTWWLGDAVGALVVGPIVILWSAPSTVPWTRTRMLEAAGLLAAMIALGVLVFSGTSGDALTFLCVPPLMWAAFRFGQRETATMIGVLGVLATWATVRGLGPFSDVPANDSLLILQGFLGTMAVTSLLIGAVVGERRRDEATLARLASIVESSDDAIISKTLEGVITSWNGGAERLYGYTAAEAVGRPISFIIPPDRPDEMLRLLARLERGEHIESYETARMRKDGTRLEVSLTMSPIRNASGKIIAVSAIGRDITEEKRTQAALREATALRSVASLAVAAAHEINNPLTVVSGEVQLLARERSGVAETRIASMLEALERIREVVARMSRINRLEPADPVKSLPEMLDLKKSSSSERPERR